MSYSIAIAGCGVAGLTAALLLARQGHAVTLFEQSPQIGPVGAGILLQPSGQLVLQRLGLLDQVVARAARINRLHALTHRGHMLVDLSYGAVSPGLHAYGLHRGDLFAVLHAQVQAAGARIVLNCRVTRFRNHHGGIEIFDHQSNSRGNFDLLLAADGSRSELRRASKLKAFVYEYPHGALWALGHCVAVQDELLQFTHGSKQMCGLLPLGQNRCAIFWSLEKHQAPALMAAPFSAWTKQVRSLAPQADELLSGLRSFEDTHFATYSHAYMPRWHAGRMLLLGDAAHSMSPHLGQGVNLALLDGLTIAHALAVAATVPQAFDLYSRLRRSHTSFYAVVTFVLSPFFQSRGKLKGWARDRLLPFLPHLPVIGPQMHLTMTGLKRSYLGGSIRLPEELNHGCAKRP